MIMTKERFQELKISEYQKHNDRLYDMAIRILLAKARYEANSMGDDTLSFDESDIKAAFLSAATITEVGDGWQWSPEFIDELLEIDAKLDDEVQP